MTKQNENFEKLQLPAKFTKKNLFFFFRETNLLSKIGLFVECQSILFSTIDSEL